MSNGIEFGQWGRQSIILRDARPIDPDEAIEKRLSAERGLQLGAGVGKDRRKDKGKGKKKKREKEEEEGEREGEEMARGAEAAQNDMSLEEAGLSTYGDVPSGNGEGVRVREEDHYGFLYSISEADRH